MTMRRRKGLSERDERMLKQDTHSDEEVQSFESPGDLLYLQQTIGNQAVQRLLAGEGGAGSAVIQRDEAGGFSLGSRSTSRFSLLSPDERLRLDPAIEAQIRAIQMLNTHFEPETFQTALRNVNLNLPQPSLTPTAPNPLAGPQIPAPGPLVPRGAGPEQPREGKPGDILDAVLAIPAVENATNQLRDQAKDQVKKDWNSLSTGGKVSLISVSAVIGGGALAGILSNASSRQFLMDQVEGKDWSVPGVPGLSFQFQLTGPEQRVMFTLDLAKYIPALQ